MFFSRYAVLLINIRCPFNTIQGGSIGKGTAVKDKADIDCVVFLNAVKTVEEHKRNLKKTKKSLQSCLSKSPYKDQITFDKQTRFAVKFKIVDLSREFDVDLLPTFTTDQSQGKIGFLILITQPQYESIVCPPHWSYVETDSPFGQPPCLLQFIVHNEVYLIAITFFRGIHKLLNHLN